MTLLGKSSNSSQFGAVEYADSNSVELRLPLAAHEYPCNKNKFPDGEDAVLELWRN